MTVSIWHLSRG